MTRDTPVVSAFENVSLCDNSICVHTKDTGFQGDSFALMGKPKALNDLRYLIFFVLTQKATSPRCRNVP